MPIYATSSLMPIVAAGLRGPVVNSSPDLLERNGLCSYVAAVIGFLSRCAARWSMAKRSRLTPHKREDIRANIERTVPVHSDGVRVNRAAQHRRCQSVVFPDAARAFDRIDLSC